jgi:hypothetical protein
LAYQTPRSLICRFRLPLAQSVSASELEGAEVCERTQRR